MTSTEDLKTRVALELIDLKAVKFKAEGEPGFRLKKHETDPKAPLSPIFFNLRTPDNPKPGPLTPESVERIAQLMYARLDEEHATFTQIAGVPRAGDPFAAVLHRLCDQDEPIGRIMLEKREQGDQRSVAHIAAGNYEPHDMVLLVDDLVTEAHSKIEAVNVLEAAELLVSDIIVLIDRQQGGEEQLMLRDLTLISVFTLTELMDLYLDRQLITAKQRDEILTYAERERDGAARGPSIW
jgi:orotate phosphoribosyltransferase